MLKQIVGTVMLLVSTGALSAPVPRHATELEKFTRDWQRTEDALRLRVSVATEPSQGERAVRVGDITFCTAQAACFRAHNSGYVDIGDTSLGTASTVADVVIPVTTITDVYFNETGGSTTIAGHLELQSPVMLEKDFYGVELMIVLRKETTAGKTTYIPAQSGHGYFVDVDKVVHYTPSIQTTAKLPFGTVLTIPAGALDKPQVFNVNVHSGGRLYPTADIFPYVDLKKPATIMAPPIPGGISMHVDIAPIGLETEKEMWADLNSAALAKPGQVTMKRTGVVDSDTFEQAAEGNVKAAPGPTSDATTGKTCAEYLAQTVVLGLINLATIASGAACARARRLRPTFTSSTSTLWTSAFNFRSRLRARTLSAKRMALI